jgi:hypothetical protein
MKLSKPLVDEVSHFPSELKARYARHVVIPGIGLSGQKRLANAKVLCIGAGGLGSPVLLYLAAAGVGTLGIVDFDLVDESNLQRQIIHGESDIGTPKTQSARARIHEINSAVKVNIYDEGITRDNALKIISDYDVVIDATDNFATRYLINDACVLLKKPCVWESIIGKEIAYGQFGENLTTQGVDITGAIIGERWRIGEVLLEISEPRIPCRIFAGFWDRPTLIKEFTEANRPGTYLRILEEGMFERKTHIDVIYQPDHGITVGDLFAARSGTREKIAEIANVQELSLEYKQWANRVLESLSK